MSYDVRKHPSYDHSIEQKTRELFADYKLEAAPEGTEPTEAEITVLRCEPAPFMTYAEIMKAVEKDPFLKTVIEERERMITALAESFSPRFVGGGLPDYMIMLKSEAKSYHRDPFWEQWQQVKLQMGQKEWKQPSFTEEMVDDINAEAQRDEELDYIQKTNGALVRAAMSESEMDWEEDEDITQPGLAPGNLDVIAAPTSVSATSGVGYPRVTTEGIGLLDRCYFCATKKNITRFERNATDHVISCVVCLYDHLRWELLNDGTLRKVASEA